MFYLRQVPVQREDGSGTRHNSILGPYYDTLWKGSKEFDAAFFNLYGEGEVNESGEDHVRGIIKGPELMVGMLPAVNYYIMTEGGKTFESL